MLAALDANGLRERCLVVYTSDHGDMVGEHGLWWKHVFYEESIRVPLIVSWPGVVAAGRRCANVVSAVDVAATLVDAMDGPPLPGSPGRSLFPLIQDEDALVRSAAAWTDEAFAEYCADRYVPSEPVFQRMVRSGRWKLVHYHGERPQLFDLHDDPHELCDRAGDPACADVRAALTQRVLDGWDADAIARRLQCQGGRQPPHRSVGALDAARRHPSLAAAAVDGQTRRARTQETDHATIHRLARRPLPRGVAERLHRRQRHAGVLLRRSRPARRRRRARRRGATEPGRGRHLVRAGRGGHA